jgi:ribosomal protein S18 acetylase RimI-like enzyme
MDRNELPLAPEFSHWALLEAHADLRGAPPEREPSFSWTSPASSWGAACYRISIRRDISNDLGGLGEKLRELGCSANTGPAACGGEKGQAETEMILAAAGFPLLREAAGMVLDESSFMPVSPPSGFSLQEAEEGEGILAWAGIVSRNLFGQGDPRYAVSFAETASLLRGAGMLDAFICRDASGDPVSASAAFFGEGGAGGVYFVATEPFARRRGLGAAVTALACSRCIGRGIDPIVLQATDLGKPVYEALGFKRVSTLRRYGPPARP